MGETFGVALKRMRGEMSLRQLQSRTNYSAAYLSELERGRKQPTLRVAQRCDEALGAKGRLAALAKKAAAPEAAPEITQVHPAVASNVHVAVKKRDDGLGQVPIKELAMTAEESAQFIRRAGATANAELIEQLSDEVRALAVDFVKRPPYAVFEPIAKLRREVFTILDGHVRPEYLSDLYLLAGQLTGLLAHASADLGQPQIADAHARTAWMCADLSGQNALRAYVRWIQSNIAYWSGDYARAAETARSGQQYLSDGSGMLRLASQEARSWAACGEAEQVMRALQAAQEARDSLPNRAGEAGVFWFNPGKAAYYAAEAWLALGSQANARRALIDAAEASALLTSEDEPCPELVAAAHLDLVQAHLALEEVEAVYDRLPQVLDLPAERRTVPVVERVGKIGRGLATERFDTSVTAADLRERIALFMAYPATRELEG